MINIKHRSMIVIGFIILIILSMAGCNKAEKNNLPQNNNTPAYTLTPTPDQSGKPSTPEIDESWIKAYYDDIVKNESQYNPGLLLIDLNFDGVPELFDIFIAEGQSSLSKCNNLYERKSYSNE